MEVNKEEYWPSSQIGNQQYKGNVPFSESSLIS